MSDSERRRGVNMHSWHPWLRELLGEAISLELIREAHAVSREELGEKPKAKGASV